MARPVARERQSPHCRSRTTMQAKVSLDILVGHVNATNGKIMPEINFFGFIFNQNLCGIFMY